MNRAVRFVANDTLRWGSPVAVRRDPRVQKLLDDVANRAACDAKGRVLEREPYAAAILCRVVEVRDRPRSEAP